MPVTPEFRLARLGSVIFKMFFTIMQIILKEYITPKGLQVKFQLKDIRTTLTLNETELMEKLPNMDKFTIELCYKILRYENLMHEPKCKWGNIPQDTEVEISDDIERIINVTNEVISKSCVGISEKCYNTILQEMKDIALRVDKYLQQDTCFKMYTAICSSEVNHVNILQEMKQLQKIRVHQPVDAESENRENFTRVFLVINDTFSNIMREVIRSSFSVDMLRALITNEPYRHHFTFLEIIKFRNFSDSFDSLDIRIIYKLLRTFRVIHCPTSGWGKFPNKDDMTLSDDVERIRAYKNEIESKSNIRNDELEQYFESFRSFGHRMDLKFSQTTGYEQSILLHKTCKFDKQKQIEYENAKMELENIQTWPNKSCIQEASECLIKPYDPSLVQLINSERAYQMKRNPRGRAVIISNEHFPEPEQMIDGEKVMLKRRKGTDKDVIGLDKLFTDLHFHVKIHKDENAQKIKDILQEEAEDDHFHSNADCFILVILTHGTQNAIYGSDGKTVEIKDIKETFNARNFSCMKDRPKLFFIQACRGTKMDVGRNSPISDTLCSDYKSTENDINLESKKIRLDKEDSFINISNETDGTAGTIVAANAHRIVAMATTMDMVSYRNTVLGSWFMQAVIYVFRKSAHISDIHAMLTDVNYLVSLGRFKDAENNDLVAISEGETTGSKHFYFFPQHFENV